MKIKFKKQYKNEKQKMYVMTIEQEYYTENKQEALQQAIKDLRERANTLEQIYIQNEKNRESWDSISK